MLNRGQICEKLALNFFINQGYVKIAKNYKLAGVEIDLILKKNNQYFLIEVKSDNKWRREFPISTKQKQRLCTAFSVFCTQNEEKTQVQLAIVDAKNKIHIFELDFEL